MLLHSPPQVGVPGYCVLHDTYTCLLICNSSLAKQFESSAPLQGPPSRRTRGGFGFFAGSRLGGRESRTVDRRSLGKATLMERNGGSSPFRRREKKSVQPHQRVSQMAEEVLMRQAKALAQRRGHSLEDARQAVSDTEAGRKLRELATGEHRHKRAQEWQASVFRERSEERLMHQIGSEALSRFVADRHYSWLESYMEWLEGKEERAHYHALLEEELASLRG